ncbi:olfactory receptor 13-like [Chanos chanos]|uniref:Olfactory receptor 13-like n=1 Tax=Chanos chanos TaxID=29144 RepID=A0A6J2VS73_CHACN|nr:olfactory receptor 13-like [Chanos chanos]
MSLGNVSAKIITEFVITGFDTVENQMATGVAMLIVYVLVMLANIANIWFIIMDKRLHKPMYLFICNLAVVDMVYSTSACPTMIGVLLAGCKTISYLPCLVQMFVFHLGGVMEMFAIAAMAFDRLIAVCSPLRYHVILTNVRTLLVIVLLWFVTSVIVTVMPATVIPLPFCQSSLKYILCDYAALIRATCASPNWYFNMISIITFFLLFGTFGFICLSYFRIVISIFKMSSKNDKKKMFKTCFSHLIVIVCYYCPLFIRIILTRMGVVLTLEERHGLMIGAILGPSLVNPFIYCFRTTEIRNKILRIAPNVEPT